MDGIGIFEVSLNHSLGFPISRCECEFWLPPAKVGVGGILGCILEGSPNRTKEEQEDWGGDPGVLVWSPTDAVFLSLAVTVQSPQPDPVCRRESLQVARG